MKLRPRVLVFHPCFARVGGAELLAVEQAHLLRELGFDPHLRTFVHDPSVWDSRMGDLPVRARTQQRKGQTPRVPTRVEAEAMRWAQEGFQGADAVLAHNFPASTMTALSSFAGPRLWYCHEPPRWLHPAGTTPHLARAVRKPWPPSDARRAYLYPLLARWLVHRVTRRGVFKQGRIDLQAVDGITEIWANSEYTRDNVLRVYGPRPVEVVYPFVSFPEASHHRAGLDRSGLRVMTMTRLERIKNVDTLLRGFAHFRARECRGATMDVVGAGPREGALRRLAARLGLQEAHIRFHGFVPHERIGAIASRCDVFAMVPADEPFGMVFPEAAGRGLLLLGPDHGGPREILDGGKLGHMVDPLSVQSVAEGFARIWRMGDGEVDTMREAAASACRERFGRATIGRRIASLLARHGLVGASSPLG